MHNMLRSTLLALVPVVTFACGTPPGGNDGGDATNGVDANGTDTIRVDATGMDVPIGTDATGSDGSTTTDSGGAFGPMAFRRGVNPGYYGSGIDRRESAQLSQRAGANSIRGTLPERYLAMWGDRIEVDDWAYYRTLGIDHGAVFLVGPSAAHSTAPAGTPDWELDHYSPRNLYEPIFLADGSVNPNNYWAAYMERVARNYGDVLDVYEVWNEPDQVGGNWQVTQQWMTRAPMPSEMIWWHDTIYAYVRALRIAHEVIHRFDPTAQVTVGGVGYPSFLNAVLRYTDEPNAGAMNAEYPHTGASYIDVLSYHYYPVFGGGSSDRGVEGFFTQRDDMRTQLMGAGRGDMNYVVTESGAPRYALGSYPGSDLYASNYLLKMMTLAHYEGMVGVDWFAQGDGAAMGASQDSFAYMGLYFDYSSAQMPSDVRIAPQGTAYAWLATWLDGTAADTTAFDALAVPSTVRGAAFVRGDGGHRYVLWAHTMNDESATASFTMHTDAAMVRVRTFTVSGGEQATTMTPAGGAVNLTLTGTPTVIDTM